MYRETSLEIAPDRFTEPESGLEGEILEKFNQCNEFLHANPPDTVLYQKSPIFDVNKTGGEFEETVYTQTRGGQFVPRCVIAPLTEQRFLGKGQIAVFTVDSSSHISTTVTYLGLEQLKKLEKI